MNRSELEAELKYAVPMITISDTYEGFRTIFVGSEEVKVMVLDFLHKHGKDFNYGIVVTQ